MISNAPLTPDELDQFEVYLASLPEEAMMLEEVHGFLTAVLTAPTPLGFSDWQPLIFGGEEPAFESMEEANEIIGLLMRLYNEIADQLHAGTLVPLGHPDPEALGLWSWGYLQVLELDEAWQNDETGLALIQPMAVLSSEQDDEDDEIEGLSEHVEHARAKLGEATHALFRHFAAARRPPEPATRKTEKIGRNEPCPCGSGKKYKKCCLA